MNKNNIVLIVCDCLRTDYAYNDEVMPFLNKLKNRNYFSENSYTNAPSTYFAMPTMLTGFMPFEVTNKSGINSSNLNNYLPKVLKNRGYNTYGITANIVTSRLYGYDKHYDVFEDFWNKKSRTRKGKKLRSIASIIPKNIKNTLLKPARSITKKFFRNQNVSIRDKVRGAQIVNVLKEQPLTKDKNFIFMLFMEPHSPYAPVNKKQQFKKIEELTMKLYKNDKSITKKETETLQKLYEEECTILDSHLKETFSHLQHSLDWDNTKFIITADHGEAFGETGYYTHPNEKIDNIHHIKVPLITNDKTLVQNKPTIWTKDIYDSILDKKRKGESSFCISYTKRDSKTVNPKNQVYEPLQRNNLKEVIPMKTKSIPEGKKSELLERISI